MEEAPVVPPTLFVTAVNMSWALVACFCQSDISLTMLPAIQYSSQEEAGAEMQNRDLANHRVRESEAGLYTALPLIWPAALEN